VGVAVVAMLVGPASAAATTFCVSDAACVAAGGTMSADLGAALSSANSNAGPDRVEVGVGSFDENTATGSYAYLGTDPLELVGEGIGQTVLFDSTPAMFDPVLTVNGASTTVSGFTFEMSSASERGAQLNGGASGSNLEAKIVSGAPTNVTGFVLNGAKSLTNASTDLASSGVGSAGINVIGLPGVTIEDVQLSAKSGIFLAPSDASAENVIRRARITATDGTGVSASFGSSTLESSLVQVLTPNDIGIVVGNSNMAAVPFDIEVRNTTIIGPGTGISAAGAGVSAADVLAGAQLPSLVLRDSIVFGFLSPLQCAQFNPSGDDVPTLTVEYSNFPATGSDIDAGCVDTFINPSNVDPAFVNPASDFHLQMGSPLIDAGTPGPLGGGESATDLDGNPRLADGNGDGIARRDLGAFERAAPSPPGGAATPAPRSFSGDLTLRVLKKKSKLAGALSSDSPACLLGRLIEVFRVRKGPDPRVGTAVAGSDGRFKLGRRVGPGRYYGEVDPLSLPGGDSCAADRSAKAKLKAP
jgi:hypothetical protein